MLEGRDIEAAVRAADALTISARPRRWGHLSLNLLEAVFTPGTSRASTTGVIRRYAEAAGLRRVQVPADLIPVPGEQDLRELIAEVEGLGIEAFSRDVLGSTLRTSTRGGVLRAEATVAMARRLAQAGVTTMSTATDLCTEPVRVGLLSRRLAAVPGHGSGARLSQLWRLLGDDGFVHVDEPVQRWCTAVSGRPLHPMDIRSLLTAVAGSLNCSPWELDHAIWQAERQTTRRTPSAAKMSTTKQPAQAIEQIRVIDLAHRRSGTPDSPGGVNGPGLSIGCSDDHPDTA